MKLRRFWVLSVLLTLSLALSTALGACSGKAAELSGETLTVTDDLGRKVKVPLKPERVAALIGSFADVWKLAGGELVATANDAWTQFDLNLDKSVKNLGKTTAISLENLVATNPQLVIASKNTRADMELRPSLEQMGIPTLYFDVNNFEEYLHMLRICTQITGREDLYEKNGLAVQKQIQKVVDEVKSRNRHPQVLYLRATAVSVKVKGSRGTVLGEMLKNLGCVNVADREGSLLETLSIEKIIEADPEYIFIVEQGSKPDAVKKRLTTELTGNPAWAGLRAVKSGKLYFLDQKLYNLKPNNRWGVAYEGLAKILSE